MNTQISPVQIILPITILSGLALAGFFGLNIAHENYTQLAFVAIGACIVAWAMIGRKTWWLPIFFFLYLGGHFFYGFKIYASELAVLVCLLPLVVTLAMKREHFKNRNFGVPHSVTILFFYLCLSFLVCVIHNRMNSIGGVGGVSRVYLSAIFPFFILIPFMLVGHTKYIKWALLLVAVATVIRFSIGMYTAFYGDEDTILFIPGINFVPSGGFGMNDLRGSGSTLVAVAICYFCLTKNPILRFGLFLIMVLGGYGTFLGGGRVTIVLSLMLFAFAFLIYRRYGAMLLFAALLLVSTVALNSFPEVLHEFPKTVAKAATVFLIDRDLAQDTAASKASDEWHFRLMQEGYKAWTENAFTIFFGKGTRPFDVRAWGGGKDFEGMIEMAVATNRYESSLWTILATFGLVGFTLYIIVLCKIMFTIIPVLLREKIRTPDHAIMFLAAFQCISWFLLCWISGGFPSTEILFGVVAMVAAHDMKRQRVADSEKSLKPKMHPLGAAPENWLGTPMK